MRYAYIYDHVRTPRGKGKSDGSLHEITPIQLASQALKAIADRQPAVVSSLDDVVLGCVSPVGEQGADIARVAAIVAGLPEHTAGVQINRFCASGLEAVSMAAAKVITGEAEFAMGGGVESMSRVPMGSDGGAWYMDPAVAFKSYFIPQGISADLISTRRGYSRNDLDSYAAASHQRAAFAWENGYFDGSVIAVTDVMGAPVLERDEVIRPGTSVDSLAALKPAFETLGATFPGFDAIAIQRYPDVERVTHLHHAGNSSSIVDGAAAVLVGSEAAGKVAGIKPRARIVSSASVGSDPTIMLTGPTLAAKKALRIAELSAQDIDLWELNEAFASVVLNFMDDMGVEHNSINVNGGAIAMGHPLGATGAMILGTVLDELERTGKQRALVTLCVAAGMGTAVIIERV